MYRLTTTALLLTGTILCAAQSAVGAEPKVTADGLHKVEASRVDLAYARPGTDWSKYRSVHVAPLIFAADAFRLAADEGQIPSEEDLGVLQQAYAAIWRAELQKEGFAVVDAPRGDTLRIASEVTGVFASEPGSTPGTTPSGWIAVKVVMTDAATGATLATAEDLKFQRYLMHDATRESNSAQVRDAFQNWAHILSQELRERANAPKVDLWACLNERKLCPPSVYEQR